MKNLLLVVLITTSIVVTFAVQAVAVEKPAQVINDTHLVDKPSAGADKVAALEKDQNIVIKQRQRAWYQIVTEDDISGWVKMLEVKFSSKAKRESELGVKSLWNSLTSGKSDTTVSTGVRGFDEEDLKKAKAAPDQVTLLTSYSSNKEQAQIFAKQAALKANDINVKEGE